MIVSERPVGTFTRQLFLGETLDADAIAADYHSGVLTLTIPVRSGQAPQAGHYQQRHRQATGLGVIALRPVRTGWRHSPTDVVSQMRCHGEEPKFR